MKTSTSNSKKISIFLTILSIGFILLLIALISSQKKDSQVFPSLQQIFSKIGYILTHQYEILSFLKTFLRIIVALAISFVCSLFLTLLYYLKNWTISFFRPFLILAKSAPIAAIAVYMFLTVEKNLGPYFITILVTLPIMVEGFISGVDSMPKGIQNELALTNAPKIYKFIKIYLPMMKTSIITTLLQTLGLAFKVMIMGEYLCQCKQSIGMLIYDAFTLIDMATLLAVVFLVVILVYVGELLTKWIEKKIYKVE